jgi:hypothetical protein
MRFAFDRERTSRESTAHLAGRRIFIQVKFQQRLFVGCRSPARLVVLDTTSGRIVTGLPTVGDTDDVFYDPVRRLVYVIGGEGAVEVPDNIIKTITSQSEESQRRREHAPGCLCPLLVAYL